MTDTIRKRRDERARYDANFATWHTLDDPKPCPDCDGDGTVFVKPGDVCRGQNMIDSCPACHGTGLIRGTKP